MRFEITAMTAEGMAKTINEVGNFFADIFRTEISQLSFLTSAKELVFCSIILPSRLGIYPNRVTSKKSTGSLLLAVNIPYEKWMEATLSGRIDLYVDALVEGIWLANSRQLKEPDKLVLSEAAKNAKLSLHESLHPSRDGSTWPIGLPSFAVATHFVWH